MTGLAWRSLRHRATASAATFVTVLLGTALMGSFATLAATARGPVSAADRDTLTTMGTVVGAWGALIVLSAVVSTVGITVTQREVEIGLLRRYVKAGPQAVMPPGTPPDDRPPDDDAPTTTTDDEADVLAFAY